MTAGKFTLRLLGNACLWFCVSLACAHYWITNTGLGSPKIWQWDSEAWIAAFAGMFAALGAAIGTLVRRQFLCTIIALALVYLLFSPLIGQRLREW